MLLCPNFSCIYLLSAGNCTRAPVYSKQSVHTVIYNSNPHEIELALSTWQVANAWRTFFRNYVICFLDDICIYLDITSLLQAQAVACLVLFYFIFYLSANPSSIFIENLPPNQVCRCGAFLRLCLLAVLPHTVSQ